MAAAGIARGGETPASAEIGEQDHGNLPPPAPLPANLARFGVTDVSRFEFSSLPHSFRGLMPCQDEDSP